MKVLFLTNIPSPYRVDFFNELGKLCDLTVMFESKKAKARDKSWEYSNYKNFNAVFLNGIKVGEAEAFCPSVIKYLSEKKYDSIVVGVYSSPTGMLAIEYMKMKKTPFILSTDGGIVKNDNILNHKIKKHFISSATAWLSTGKTATDYLCHYGAEKDKCYVYPFTSVSKEKILKKVLTSDEKNMYKSTLSIKESKMIISVGQFIHRKGYDILLKACSGLDENIGIYIIGGTPTTEYLNLVEQYNLTNVHFLDFMPPDKLENYFKAADLFVLPTREDIWGLVINEAMEYGLPIVTTNKCVAGLELVEDGINGKIVDVDDINQLAESINKILSDNFLLEKYSLNSLEKIQEYTLENMAKKHIEFLKNIVKEKRIL
ncbi:MAG: glycosyltransferase family 4 protein [Clostridia bacterium]